MQTEVKKSEYLSIAYELAVIFFSVFFAVIGYVIFNLSFFKNINVPTFVHTLYIYVKDINEIVCILPIPVITIIVQFFKLQCVKKHKNKHATIFKLINIILFVLCIVMSTVVGISVAEKNSESEVVNSSYNNYSNGLKKLSREEVFYFEKYNCVEIKFAPPRTSSENVIAYNVISFKITKISHIENILNPLSSVIHMIKKTEYVKYKIILKPIYDDGENISPPSTECSNIDNVELASTEHIRQNDILVVIEEVLVKKDGNPFIKLNSMDPQTIEYGYSKNKLKEEIFTSSSEGYIIEFQQDGNRFVQWNNELKCVSESNKVYFEDYYMEKNTPFKLTSENLKAIIDKNLPTFSDRNLKITLKNIKTSEEYQISELPLEMSTREKGILYHWQYEKDDFYFAINSLSNGTRFIAKEVTDKDDYRLLCEITIK